MRISILCSHLVKSAFCRPSSKFPSIQCFVNSRMSTATSELPQEVESANKRPASEDLDVDDAKKIKEVANGVEDVEKTESKVVEAPKKIVRVRSQKFAILLSYCGSGYYGLQRNPPFPTIEEEFLIALRKTELITEEEYDKPNLLYFQRAARTDKGVSAAKQILSVRLPQVFPEQLDAINSIMVDKKIKVIAAKRTTKYFDSKNYCDARTYSYLMPTYALAPPDATVGENFLIDKAQVIEFNEILALYHGTHNYHNFTSQRDASDASSQRYIITMESSEPFMKGDVEWIVVRVKGQSFMLHQIRKMVGLAIAIMRGLATVETLKTAFQPARLDIPKAPGLGLMLEEVHYDRYSKRYGGDGIHEPLTWGEHAEEVNQFKESFIYPLMVETEKSEKVMFEWLKTLAWHSYSTERMPGPNQPISEASKNDRTLLQQAAFNAGLIVDKKRATNQKEDDESANRKEADPREEDASVN